MHRGQRPLLPEKREVVKQNVNVDIAKERAEDKKNKMGIEKDDLVRICFNCSKLTRNFFFLFPTRLLLFLRSLFALRTTCEKAKKR
jgi:hypothetical protein